MRAQFRKARKLFQEYRQEILWAKAQKRTKKLNNALVPPGYDPSGLSRKSEPDILDIAREADEPKAEDVAALWQKLANAAPADNALVPTSTPDPRSHVRHPYYTPNPAMSTAMVSPYTQAQNAWNTRNNALQQQLLAQMNAMGTMKDPLSGQYHQRVAQPGGEILHPGGATATETPFVPQMTPRNPKERHPPRHFQTPDGGTWKIKGKEVPMPKEGDSVWAYIEALRDFALEVDPTGNAPVPESARSSHPCGWEFPPNYARGLGHKKMDLIDLKIMWDDRREWGPYPTMGIAPKTKSWGQVPDIPLPDEWKGFSPQEVTV